MTAEPRAMRAGQPFAVASDGIVIQTSSEDAERADRRARDPVPARQRRAVTRVAVDDDAEAETERLAERRDEHEEEHRDRHAVVGAGAAERGDDARHEVDADDEPERDATPREHARDEAESPAADAGSEHRHDDRDVERVHDRLSRRPPRGARG